MRRFFLFLFEIHNWNNPAGMRKRPADHENIPTIAEKRAVKKNISKPLHLWMEYTIHTIAKRQSDVERRIPHRNALIR
jgi:hypothetical protein